MNLLTYLFKKLIMSNISYTPQAVSTYQYVTFWFITIGRRRTGHRCSPRMLSFQRKLNWIRTC